jgi:hypothetical protein
MTADDPRALDLDVLLATIYQAQADLRILAEHLARERNPALSRNLIITLAALHVTMEDRLPSLRRH